MTCHMVAHRFAVTPRMDFQTKGLGLGEGNLPGIHGSLSQSQPDVPHDGGWFGFWEARDDVSDFVVRDYMHNVANVGNGVDSLPDLV